MGFPLPQLIVESVLRDGFKGLRNDPTLIDDVFPSLKESYLSKKYGQKELEKIKRMFTDREVGVVHAFNQVPSNVPCISIQLMDEGESRERAHLDDFEADVIEDITDPEELAELVLLSDVEATAYDINTGKLSLDDSVNLTNIHANHVFVDFEGNEFVIQGGIVDVTGNKSLLLEKGQDPEISGPCSIKSGINYKQYERRGQGDDCKLLLGIHTKEPLETVYLYEVVKYVLLSLKKHLIQRGFLLASYHGSDFTRHLDYPADTVFSRFLTVTGYVQNSWKSDRVIPIDYVETQILVEKNVATTAQVNRVDQTVQVNDGDEE